MLANGTLVPSNIVPGSAEPHQSQRFRSGDGECDLGAENFYTISTDTHIDDMVIVAVFLRNIRGCGGLQGGANKNIAGAVYFSSLLDENLLVARGEAVSNHPGGTASGSGTGCGIVSAIKNHAGVEAGFGVEGFAGDEVEKLSAGAREIFGSSFEVELEVLQSLEGGSGAMVKGTPVETVWMGAESSKSAAVSPVRRATAAASWMAPKTGFCCVISPKRGWDGG